MGKHIVRWGYWLGIVSLVLAFLARAVNILGLNFLHFVTKGNPVGYHSFLDGAALFFLMAIATESYRSFNSHNHRS